MTHRLNPSTRYLDCVGPENYGSSSTNKTLFFFFQIIHLEKYFNKQSD